MYCREQQCNDKSPYPGKKEELRAEAPKQVGYATWKTDNLPHVCAVEKEKLVLFLIMQMMRIGQSEKEEDSHAEQTTYQILY